MSELSLRADPQHVANMAAELWETQGHLDPAEAAQAEYDEWPPHDM